MEWGILLEHSARACLAGRAHATSRIVLLWWDGIEQGRRNESSCYWPDFTKHFVNFEVNISILIGCTPLHDSMLSHLVCVEHYDSRNFELSNSISSSAVNVLQSSSPEVLHTNSMRLSCKVPIKILTFTSKPTKRFVKPGQYNSWTRFFSLARCHPHHRQDLDETVMF